MGRGVHPNGMAPLLSVNAIRKEFPGVRAVDRVTFELRAGQILAIVGENGAGKSTLVKILAGVYPAGTFDGELRIDGMLQEFKSIAAAQAAGVVLVPQELRIAPELTIADNMFMGRLPGKWGIVDVDRLNVACRKWLDFAMVNASPGSRMGSLSSSEQRLVVIAAALSTEARILILDEPTASLSEDEAQRLFAHMQHLRSAGVGCIYISHRLDEVERAVDSMIVMRDGRVVASFDGSLRGRRSEVVRAIIGRDPEAMVDRRIHEGGDTVLVVKDLHVADAAGRNRVDGVSFDLHRGEVLGLYGLVGAGRSELAGAIFGSAPGHVSGEVVIAGRSGIPRSPEDAIKHGVAMLAEDRHKSGLVPGHTLNVNVSAASLARVSRFGVVSTERELARNRTLVKRLNVRPPRLQTIVDYLSGGNQQKALLARWLATAPEVLILDEPTTGVDVNSRYGIYGLMHELAAEGRGVLLVSSDLEEVSGQCDRVLVMFKGKIRAELAGPADRHLLMAAATGGGH